MSNTSECSICLDGIEAPAVTPCGHWFCKGCISEWLESKGTCALCRAAVQVQQLKLGVPPGGWDWPLSFIVGLYTVLCRKHCAGWQVACMPLQTLAVKWPSVLHVPACSVL